MELPGIEPATLLAICQCADHYTTATLMRRGAFLELYPAWAVVQMKWHWTSMWISWFTLNCQDFSFLTLKINNIFVFVQKATKWDIRYHIATFSLKINVILLDIHDKKSGIEYLFIKEFFELRPSILTLKNTNLKLSRVKN